MSASSAGRLLLAFGSLSCVQSDLVAIERAPDPCGEPDQCSCSAASCDSVLEQPLASFCSGRGFVAVGGDSCASAAAATRVHRYAVCSCTDYAGAGRLETHAFVGTPTMSLENRADVGINGDFDSAASIAGTLRLAGALRTQPASSVQAARGIEQNVPAPCACDEQDLLTFSPLLTSLEAQNDNAQIGLSERELDGVEGDASLSLLCGRYLLSRMAVTGTLRLNVTGRVLLFVRSNLELDGSFEVNLAEGAQLELFVAGNMRVAGSAQLGDPARGQSALRLHVGGTGSLNLQGTATIAGVLEAPRAELVTAEDLTLYGALFVRRAAPGGELVVHYDTELANAAACPE